MRLHLVDGTYELFRAFFAKRPSHRDPRGRDRKATVGVVSSMLALLADPREGVTHVAAAFDNPVESFRNDLFDGYKTSYGVPAELLEQFDAVEEAMRAIGVTVWSMKEWEADDALATGARRFRDWVEQVRILTPDKDLGQCLLREEGRDRVVQVDRMRDRVLDVDTLHAKLGILPESVPDFLALVGDTADGIPGVPGFGEVAAGKLLARWVHLEAIPDVAAAWDVPLRGADRLAENLRAHREQAALYRKLATLVDDVPLREDLDDLAWTGVPRDAFTAWCDAVGAKDELRARPQRFR